MRTGSLLAVGVLATAVPLVLHAPSAAQEPSPSYTVFAAPEDLRGSDQAGEPSVGVNRQTGAVMYQSGLQTYRISLNAVGPTARWKDVTSPTTPFNVDPILSTDAVTGRTFAGGLAGACSLLAYTDDDGSSWAPVGNACSPVFDHESIGSGAWSEPRPALATYDRAVYYCASLGYEACATSLDGGLTYLPSVLVEGGCSGLHGHLKVALDGTAYLPTAHCGGRVGGAVTTDNGQTWTSYSIPGSVEPRNGFDPSVAVTPDGTLWESWSGDDGRPLVARSTTRGATWDPIVDLSTTVEPALTTTAFPAAVAGDDGRVAVAFLGTTDPGDALSAGWQGVWHLYVATTYDGGATWTTVRTTEDPVQRGWICDDGMGCAGGRNLLDFMDADVLPDGRVVVAFADGCTGECAGPDGREDQSTSARASLAYQTGGPRLLSAPEPEPSPSPSPSPSQGPQVLVLGRPSQGVSAPAGEFSYWALDVPTGTVRLTVELVGPPCTASGCDPQLDLYLRSGQPPTTTDHHGRSVGSTSDETISTTGLIAGRQWIGVHTAAGTTAGEYTLVARAE